MVKAVTPSLPEPGVWTGMAAANVLEPLRWKRAKTHRGSRHRHMPHQEAGYTSAAVALDPQHAEHRCNRAGSIYVHTWHFCDITHRQTTSAFRHEVALLGCRNMIGGIP